MIRKGKTILLLRQILGLSQRAFCKFGNSELSNQNQINRVSLDSWEKDNKKLTEDQSNKILKQFKSHCQYLKDFDPMAEKILYLIEFGYDIESFIGKSEAETKANLLKFSTNNQINVINKTNKQCPHCKSKIDLTNIHENEMFVCEHCLNRLVLSGESILKVAKKLS